MPSLDEIRQLRKAHDDHLLALPNVVGVGTGYRVVGGQRTDELAVVVSTRRKLPRGQLRTADIVPPSLSLQTEKARIEVKTDVVQTGEFFIRGAAPARVAPYTNKIRPVPPGYEIGVGLPDWESGTLGVWVTDGQDNYLLSNSHVIVVDNQSGADVYQPGVESDPVAEKIGYTTHWTVLQLNQAVNYLDAALALVNDISLIDPNYPGVGPLRGHYPQISLGWHLRKVASASGLVDGTVTNIDYKGIFTDRRYGNLYFENQVIVSGPGVVAAGDSGAVWITDDNFAALLHFAFAGSQDYAAGAPLNWAIGAFKLKGIINSVRGRTTIAGTVAQGPQKWTSSEDEATIIEQIAKRIQVANPRRVKC